MSAMVGHSAVARFLLQAEAGAAAFWGPDPFFSSSMRRDLSLAAFLSNRVGKDPQHET